MAKLSVRELTCAEVLVVEKGKSVRSVARDLGVDESTLRYRLARRRDGAVDGRSLQVEACAPFESVIQAWIDRQPWGASSAKDRPEPVKALYEQLVAEHGFSGSYKSVQRFVRRRAPVPAVRPVRRVETRPGTQAQVNWGTRKIYVHELGGIVPLKAFLMTLSHSRMNPVRFYPDEAQLSWLDAHNHALTFLGGVPLTIRIDNLKTGVKQGAGPWAILNDTYVAYADQVGFLIDPARGYTATDKGKVERKVRDVVGTLVRRDERFVTLDDLNDAASERSIARAKRTVNPVTGETVFDTWLAEREVLQPLPDLPIPFDVQVARPVTRDCLVHFEGRQYAAPFPLAGRVVQVRGVPGRVQILANGHVVREYARGTKARLLIDQDVYEPTEVAKLPPSIFDPARPVHAPTPLGRIGRAIVAEKSWEATTRPLSEYEALLRRSR